MGRFYSSNCKDSVDHRHIGTYFRARNLQKKENITLGTMDAALAQLQNFRSPISLSFYRKTAKYLQEFLIEWFFFIIGNCVSDDINNFIWVIQVRYKSTSVCCSFCKYDKFHQSVTIHAIIPISTSLFLLL